MDKREQLAKRIRETMERVGPDVAKQALQMIVAHREVQIEQFDRDRGLK